MKVHFPAPPTNPAEAGASGVESQLTTQPISSKRSAEDCRANGPALLTRVAAGDHAAVAEVIEVYGGLIATLAKRFCVNNADTDDAVQEIFVELWKNASRFQPEKGSEVTFVAMIARRRLVDLYRRRQQRTVVDIEVDNIPLSDEPPFGNHVELDEQMENVVLALKQMPELQRSAILLAVYHGKTHRQVAHQMDLPLGTVKTWIRQGLRSMRRQLETKNTPKAVPQPLLLKSV